MKLRKKTQIVLGAMMLIMLLLLDVLFTGILRQAAEKTDRGRMESSLSRIVLYLNGGEALSLNAIASNWAYSEATWEYMMGKNPGYPTKELNRKILTSLGISSIILLDKKDRVRLFKDFSSAGSPSAPDEEYTYIMNDMDNRKRIDSITASGGVSGIVCIGDRSVLFTAKAVLKGDMTGDSPGYIIVTKLIDSALINKISRTLGFSFTIDFLTEEEKAQADSLSLVSIDMGNRKQKAMKGRMLVKDKRGVPVFWISGISSKEDISAMEKKLQYLFLVLAGVALIICFFFDWAFFRRLFSKRVALMRDEIEAMHDNTSARDGVTVDKYKDEISVLQKSLNDVIAFYRFIVGKQRWLDNLSVAVHEKFAKEARRICCVTMEDIASAITPAQESLCKSIPRMGRMTEHVCRKLGMDEKASFYAYMGALFSRIGLLKVSEEVRRKGDNLSVREQKEYSYYPIFSKDILESVKFLMPAAAIPTGWNENWDGSGFPLGLVGTAIPKEARIFAIVDVWNEMTRTWPGRKLPSQDEVEDRLRSLAGTRLDPELVEKFIWIMREAKDI